MPFLAIEISFPEPVEISNEHQHQLVKLIGAICDAWQAQHPEKGMWAPGGYMCKCANCGDEFEGDKMAFSCADCAYNENWLPIERAPKDGTRITTAAGCFTRRLSTGNRCQCRHRSKRIRRK